MDFANYHHMLWKQLDYLGNRFFYFYVDIKCAKIRKSPLNEITFLGNKFVFLFFKKRNFIVFFFYRIANSILVCKYNK